jgi:hypothetical protein
VIKGHRVEFHSDGGLSFDKSDVAVRNEQTPSAGGDKKFEK